MFELLSVSALLVAGWLAALLFVLRVTHKCTWQLKACGFFVASVRYDRGGQDWWCVMQTRVVMFNTHLNAAVLKARRPEGVTPANIRAEEQPSTVRVACSDAYVALLLMLVTLLLLACGVKVALLRLLLPAHTQCGLLLLLLHV